MKFLTYILAFAILFLLAKPAMDAIPFSSLDKQAYCSNSQCNSISENKKAENSSDKEDNGLCNPFQACGSCLLLCVNIAFFSTVQAKISNKNFFGYQSIIASQFSADFWQPPQFV